MKTVFRWIGNVFKYMWYGILVMVDPDYVIAKEIDEKGRKDDRDNKNMGSPDS